MTPCGMVVMGGGGEGEVKAWNCDNGESGKLCYHTVQ